MEVNTVSGLATFKSNHRYNEVSHSKNKKFPHVILQPSLTWKIRNKSTSNCLFLN